MIIRTSHDPFHSADSRKLLKRTVHNKCALAPKAGKLSASVKTWLRPHTERTVSARYRLEWASRLLVCRKNSLAMFVLALANVGKRQQPAASSYAEDKGWEACYLSHRTNRNIKCKFGKFKSLRYRPFARRVIV